MRDTRIGFIGQGFIGKNYADDFEARGQNALVYHFDLVVFPEYGSHKMDFTLKSVLLKP